VRTERNRRRAGPGRDRAAGALTALLGTLALAAFTGVGSPAAQTAKSADLMVTKSDSPDPVAVRAPLTYTVTVLNFGPDPATDVRLVDRLPNSVISPIVSTTAGSCRVSGRTVACNLGRIGIGTNASTPTVTITATPTRPGRFTNSASVRSTVADPRPANDLATEPTRVLPVRIATCAGVPATVIGTGGADRLVGTRGNDVVLARRGADVIRTFAGHDVVCAGRGADVVRAGIWADRVFGNRGDDRLLGGGGADDLFGNRGADRLFGRSGADKLNGGPGLDACRGNRGADLELRCER
jgi:uncharacterized repeat protein (TIGR01451 family)